MIYRRKRRYTGDVQDGFLRLERMGAPGMLHGSGDGGALWLRDDSGELWRGSGERLNDGSVRYTFRSQSGATLTGISDGPAILLRDERGRSWRGFLE